MTSGARHPVGTTHTAPLTEASFALRRRETDLRLAERSGRPQLSGPRVLAASAVSLGAPRAGEPRPSKRTAASGKASSGSRGGSSPSPHPVSAEDRATGPPVAISIGVISDNHGYLDLAVLEHIAGVVHNIHAGDIIDPEILAALETVAPVTAVAGNMDSGGPLAGLPREMAGEIAGVRFALGHKRKRLLKRLAEGKVEGDLEGATPDLVVYGHDHIPAAAWVEGTLFLNPGSASAPHEEDDWPTVAIVSVKPAGLAVCFIPLERREPDEALAT